MNGWAEAVATVVERHVREGVVPGAAWLLDDGDQAVSGVAGSWDLDGGVPATEDVVLRIASLTKPVVAALALQLVEDGVLDLVRPWRACCPSSPAGRCCGVWTVPLTMSFPQRGR